MNKRILLTGATGFLGSHLLESFISNGFEVSILKRSTSQTFRIDFLVDQYESYNIDEKNLKEIFEVVKPDIVVHTACSYGRNNETTFEVLETNLIFALELLKESEVNNVRTFINTDTLLPKNINEYSLSKTQFREWLEIKSKNIQVVNLRLEHIYGPKDDDSKFVPWLLNKMICEEGSIKLTSGIQKRDFIYITDLVAVYLLIINKANGLPNWNLFDIGTNHLIEMKSFVLLIAQIVKKIFGKQIIHRLEFGAIEYRPFDVMTPTIDASKIKKLGWTPAIDISEGLELIINNYK